MDNLWAPWRMRYIEKYEEKSDCIFCVKPTVEDDKENLILYRGETCFIIMNKYPYNNGHLMIVPYRHLSDLNKLTEAELLEINKLLLKSYNALQKSVKPHGFNIGLNLGRVAGAGIDQHLHYHIVPRWNGDTNFMPVTGQTKVISQAIEETRDILFELLNQE